MPVRRTQAGRRVAADEEVQPLLRPHVAGASAVVRAGVPDERALVRRLRGVRQHAQRPTGAAHGVRRAGRAHPCLPRAARGGAGARPGVAAARGRRGPWPDRPAARGGVGAVMESERALAQPPVGSSADGQVERWRAEFPYHWDADDLVARRQLLRFAVYSSGALFASTAFLALLGALTGRAHPAAKQVARVGDVPEGRALYFAYPEPDDQAMLLHLPGGRFVAYSQRCTHLSCAVYYQPERGRLYCPCH